MIAVDGFADLGEGPVATQLPVYSNMLGRLHTQCFHMLHKSILNLCDKPRGSTFIK